MTDTAPPELDPETVYIFTDGSFRYAGEANYGGWAAVLIKGGKRKELSGSATDTTINRMELTAILEGIRALNVRDTSKVAIYSDSSYAVNCVTAWGRAWEKNGWIGSDGLEVKNRDLIEAILKAFLPRMRIGWVKGHSDHRHNDRADKLAKEARDMEQNKAEGLDIYPPELAKAIRRSKTKQQALMAREAAERLAARAPKPRVRTRRSA